MRKPLRGDELVNEVEWQIDARTSASLICLWLEMRPDTIAHALRRAGRSDLATPFWTEHSVRKVERSARSQNTKEETQ